MQNRYAALPDLPAACSAVLNACVVSASGQYSAAHLRVGLEAAEEGFRVGLLGEVAVRGVGDALGGELVGLLGLLVVLLADRRGPDAQALLADGPDLGRLQVRLEDLERGVLGAEVGHLAERVDARLELGRADAGLVRLVAGDGDQPADALGDARLLEQHELLDVARRPDVRAAAELDARRSPSRVLDIARDLVHREFLRRSAPRYSVHCAPARRHGRDRDTPRRRPRADREYRARA